MALDLDALETSFDLVAPRGDELMDAFYARLFATAPAVEPLFAGTDLRRQKAMLLGALVLLRKSLRDLDAIVPALRDLGARHAAYGAEPAHYPVVGAVLIASMEEIAGLVWRAGVRDGVGRGVRDRRRRDARRRGRRRAPRGRLSGYGVGLSSASAASASGASAAATTRRSALESART